MKKVLILVIGCQLPPWDKMAYTSLYTWDSIHSEGCETIYYFGNPMRANTDKFIYFPINESYNSMGTKMIMAFEWALENKEFDYIARINSSCYVDKKELINYVISLPTENVFVGGIVAESKDNPSWCWGGLQYIISKDVIEKVVENKNHLNSSLMEDQALSYLVSFCKVPYTSSVGACSIDKTSDGWNLISYGGESITFKDFIEIKRLNNHFYRCKNDADRNVDEYVMQQLFNILK